MAKRKRSRTPRKQTRNSKPPVTISKDDLVVGHKIGRYHPIVILLAMVPVTYVGRNFDRIDATMGGLLLDWMSIVFVLALVGIFIQIRGLFSPSMPFLTDPKKFRRYGIFLLALAIFINVLAWVPILYANGYIARLLNLLPGKEELGDKVSLVIAFGLGAIISGVLGNFAYDILKHLFKKMVRGKPN
jgi:hypothetical protein